jgi:hypothetical protein
MGPSDNTPTSWRHTGQENSNRFVKPISEAQKGHLNMTPTSLAKNWVDARPGLVARDPLCFIFFNDYLWLAAHPTLEVMLVVMQGLPETLMLHFVLQPGHKPGIIGLLMVFAVRPDGIHLAFYAGELAPQGDRIDAGHETHQEDQRQDNWYYGNGHGHSLAVRGSAKRWPRI